VSQRVWRLMGDGIVLGAHTRIMAIVNATPDSFSGDGLHRDHEAAVAVGLRAFADGADIVDVGGVSTRPHAVPIDEEEELRRVIPVLRSLDRQTRQPISVDTSTPRVARDALEAGARIINDVSGLARTDEIARLAAQTGAGLVLMRFPGFPVNRPRPWEDHAGDLIEAVQHDLTVSATRAVAVGVLPDAIVLDPGFGFGLLAADSMHLLRRFHELQSLRYPLLAAVSRKGFTGQPIGLPVSERQWGTAAAHTLLIAQGVDILRVHDVPSAIRVAQFTDAVLRTSDDVVP